MKTTTQHTPEPWTRDGLRIIRNPGTGGLFNIATCSDPTANQTDGKPETRLANAARICACVNACAGLSDPANIAALREALRDCVESLQRLPNADNAFRITCIQQARAALARVEGGKK